MLKINKAIKHFLSLGGNDKIDCQPFFLRSNVLLPVASLASVDQI